MARYCNVCGKELEDTAVFCTECGTSVNQAPPAEPIRVYEMPGQTPPPYVQATPEIDPACGIVGTGTYFGLMFLFVLPGIGLLFCSMFCFIPKRRSLKNFARAMLIWSVIALVLAVLAAIAAKMALNAVVEYLNQAMGGDLTNLEGWLMEIQQGGLDEILATLPAAPQ